MLIARNHADHPFAILFGKAGQKDAPYLAFLWQPWQALQCYERSCTLTNVHGHSGTFMALPVPCHGLTRAGSGMAMPWQCHGSAVTVVAHGSCLGTAMATLPLVSYGSAMGALPSDFHGSAMGLNAHQRSSMFNGAAISLPWDCHGTAMGVLCMNCHRLPWQCHELP